VIGLGDGTLCVQWDYKKFYYFGHVEPVTSIKIIGNKIFSGSADYCIRSFDLSQFGYDNHFFQGKSPIVSLVVIDDFLYANCYNGRIYKFNPFDLQL
jgi:hypothetical protein